MLAAGAKLGPYEILAPLGAGGMGEVYRAHDPRLGRDVAIKVLPSHLAASPEVRARFEREARTVSRLDHPHICALHDIGRHEDTDYLVMELLEGETLAHRLEKGPLPVAEVLALGTQIADALDRAHRAGVVHRDLKPGNVMLTRSGAKLMDFGLARATGLGAAPGLMTESPTVSRPLTKEGTIVGTFQYMAPEQLEGKEADARSDLWALGCVLYEAATGQRAFAGESQASLIAAILEHEPRPIAELKPLSPPALEHVVRRCLAKDPEQRWQSARDVVQELEWIAGAGSQAGAPAGHPPGHPAEPGRSRAVPPGARWRPAAAAVAAGVVVVMAVVAALWATRSRREAPPVPAAAPAPSRADIAVLPFQNLSAGGPHAYFAGGLHDELLTQLAKVAALKVISRTSVMGYSAAAKPLKQIAAELGVGSIVEGSVQVAGNRLRVNVQLIDAATDEHLWAERYDRTLDDAFAIQSDVAQRIVAAVGATLSSDEEQGITAVPTPDPEAYRLYLQGENYRRRPGFLRQNLEIAQRFYEQSLALDPGLALARASLSMIHGEMYWSAFDPVAARAARQRDEAQKALRLAPELPQAHVAMGLAHYQGRGDWARALEEFRTALRAMPNDADAWANVAWAQRRLGNWAAVDSGYRQAVRLDPRNADVFEDLGGWTYMVLRRYADAVRACNRALVLAPDLTGAALTKGQLYVLWKGDLDTLAAVLDEMPGDEELGGPYGSGIAWRAKLLLWARKSKDLVGLMRSVRPSTYDAVNVFQPALAAAWGHRLLGDEQAARAAFGGALDVLDTVSISGQNSWTVHAARGLALAGLGRRDEALREARWLQGSAIYRKDSIDGPLAAEERARILAQAGDAPAALEELERLLAGPSFLSVHTLRLDPRWDPVREHPRFKALLVKYARPEEWAVR